MIDRKRIAFAADDTNECVDQVRAFLDAHHDVIDVGSEASWPTMASALAVTVADGDADLGVVMCWTGTGTAIAANKVTGARAAQAADAWTATGARRWNDANVLALSLKRLAPDVAVECVRAFVETDAVDEDERDAIDELKALDRDR